jgi:hypothetical protein
VLRESFFLDVAAIFGTDRDRPADDSGRQVSSDIIEQRLAHARGEGPEPVARPVDPTNPILAYAMTPPE